MDLAPATRSAARSFTGCCSGGTSPARCPSRMPRGRSSRRGSRAPTPCRPSARSRPCCVACMSEVLARLTKLPAAELGALQEKVVLGSINRGGLAGSVFEIDGRFTGYTAAAIAGDGLTGGKMMLRVADDDPATVRTMEACARAIDELAALGLPAMIEV